MLAVEAVIGEPVSISYFPVSRENTGKFAEFRPIDDNNPAPSQWNSMTWQRNSLSGKTGKMSAETANEKPFSRDNASNLNRGLS